MFGWSGAGIPTSVVSLLIILPFVFSINELRSFVTTYLFVGK
ncbi:hypothetical protein [Salipaludibacillus daqingensis]|nr:hypothetical protein [Salipaludibacillus daqingensis]